MISSCCILIIIACFIHIEHSGDPELCCVQQRVSRFAALPRINLELVSNRLMTRYMDR